MRIALFEPDIAANTGAIIRLGACLAVPVDVIEPCGFPFGDASLRRAGLDYMLNATVIRHQSWQAFREMVPARLIIASTKASRTYTDFRYEPGDTLMFGRESAGVPDDVAMAADARVRIPMAKGMRSLNVAISAGMVLGEALRQTGGFAGDLT